MTPEQIYPNAYEITYIEPDEGYAVATIPYSGGLFGIVVLAVSQSKLVDGEQWSPFLLLTITNNHQHAEQIHQLFVNHIRYLYDNINTFKPIRVYESPASNNYRTLEIDEIIGDVLKHCRRHLN